MPFTKQNNWKQNKGKLGTICTMWGVVKWIDQNSRRIKLVTDEDSQWISMDHITAVKADYGGLYGKVSYTKTSYKR
ncbi:YolD-like family protein [Brevibacillus sp. DP1.3A]|uniref:YolD-like family protein n=1 Tax=Brevibacillus sp. DP1.3A TaxID=2738867 RepID=UPI001D15FD51|nr:YolD-like family protein [Brevibacillus sp. DP1.3A]UED73225.1 YolD-like family protein [Brevibacillus sp. DP1.3A]